MFYVERDDAFLERPIKPLYGKTQATAQDWTLAAADLAAKTLKPGFIMTAGTENGKPVATVCNATRKPLGFNATWMTGISNEVTNGEGTKTSIWVLGSDAMFFLDKSVIDTTAFVAGASPDFGEIVLVGSNADGKATIVSDHELAVAKLVAIQSNGIIIAGLNPADAGAVDSSMAVLKSYSFKVGDNTYEFTMNHTNHTGAVTVPSGTAITAIVGTFALSYGANLKISSTAQVSGTTSNSWTSGTAKTFTVTAEDGTTTQNYALTITVAS